MRLSEQEMSSFSSPWIEQDENAQFGELKAACGHYLREYRKNSAIFHQGETGSSMYIVHSGRVRLILHSAEGRAFHVMIVKPGCIFGEVSYLTRMPYDTGAEAIVDSRIFQIPYPVVAAYLAAKPDANLSLSLSLSRKLTACTQVIDNLVMKNATAKVFTYLRYIANAHGERTKDNGIRIDIRFTHEDIANITNLSRVTVSNIISDLYKMEMLEKKDGKVCIRNIAKLDAIIAEEL